MARKSLPQTQVQNKAPSPIWRGSADWAVTELMQMSSGLALAPLPSHPSLQICVWAAGRNEIPDWVSFWGRIGKRTSKWASSFSLPSYAESAREHTGVGAPRLPKGSVFLNTPHPQCLFPSAIHFISFNLKVIKCHQKATENRILELLLVKLLVWTKFGNS